jgi:hypothetical protein
MAHEKTIAQSRDRQGADPLADARGSVRASIFEAAFLARCAGHYREHYFNSYRADDDTMPL